jgi:hypothetical protein
MINAYILETQRLADILVICSLTIMRQHLLARYAAEGCAQHVGTEWSLG